MIQPVECPRCEGAGRLFGEQLSLLGDDPKLKSRPCNLCRESRRHRPTGLVDPAVAEEERERMRDYGTARPRKIRGELVTVRNGQRGTVGVHVLGETDSRLRVRLLAKAHVNGKMRKVGEALWVARALVTLHESGEAVAS